MGEHDLQVIISPAKKMRDASGVGAHADFAPRGIPPFPELTARVLAALRALDDAQLQALWKVSDALFAQSAAHMDAFELAPTWEAACEPPLAGLLAPALFSYVGIQYQSLAPEVLDEPALAWLQGHLWMLSAVYGCARPFDAVMPYRLEMGTRLALDGARNLYDFWGPHLGPRVEAQAGMAPTCVVNLASAEYARAVLPYLSAGTPVVTCVFGEALKDGRPVQRSSASKTARGSMVRWLAQERPCDPRDLRAFDVGYRFDEALSEPGTLVFMRA